MPSIQSRLMDLHGRIYRLSGGRFGQRLPGVPPMLLLEHVGRRSGERRWTPLVYVEDGNDVAIIASKGGSRDHPHWWLNLREMPETTVWLGRERRRVRPRIAGRRERPPLWAKAVDAWPDYETYQRRTDREIPVILLSRVQR